MGYTANTCEAYRNDLSAFAIWCKANIEGARWSTLKREDIEQYITYQSQQGYKAASTNRMLSSLRSLYRFWIRQGKIDHNPAKEVYCKQLASTLPTTIRREDIALAYHHSTGTTRLIIALLYTTGIRLSELINIRWADIDMKAGTIKITGKGNRQRLVYIPKGVVNLLSDMQHGTSQNDAIITDGARSCRRLLKQAFEAVGSTEPCNPHAFRHTAATTWAMSGASNSSIAKALGHTRLETSRKYIDLAQESVKSMMVDNNMFN